MRKYSFIIPHKNSPDLLNRCIASIPNRDDVEIIVVDDGSDEDKKPSCNHLNCVVVEISSQNSKGAGKARNVGLNAASGKWIFFADADDYYTPNFLDVISTYLHDDIDIAFFDVFYTWDPQKKTERWPQRYSLSIKKYLENPQSHYWLMMVKHIIQGPWNFVIKSQYIRKIGASFEEIPKGNDAYFHHYVAMNTNRCVVIPHKIYYWLWNDSGITQRKKDKSYYLEQVKTSSRHIKLRIEAGAWDTIPPLHKGFSKVCKDQGILFGSFYISKRLLSGVPWHKVWLHKIFDKKI